MINTNGIIEESEANSFINNRGYLYGDAVFETIKVVGTTILFLEDHYFRLMSAMRIVRMKIPKKFTMEFLESEIIDVIKANDFQEKNSRVRLTVYRNSKGNYKAESNDVGYTIKVTPMDQKAYVLSTIPYEVELYKDFYVSAQLLSNVKTTNRIVNVMASVYAEENSYENCLLINDRKMIVEAINGNVFIVKNNTLITPPLTEGCIKGIMRQQIIEAVKSIDDLTVEEAVISPFDLQKSDELFITNVIQGIIPVSKYRKKEYTTTIQSKLITAINQLNNL